MATTSTTSARRPTAGVRLGLCCLFKEQPIKFRTTTAKAIAGMNREAALAKLSALCLANAAALRAALGFCAEHRIGCFRITSQILALKTGGGHGNFGTPEAQERIRQFFEKHLLGRDVSISDKPITAGAGTSR